jgi:hypothetical protein
MAVEVTRIGSGDPIELEVAVADGHGRTRHRVTLQRATLARLAPGASEEAFVAAAFEFLLEREPKESILSRFDVDVISRYFPEFETVIGRHLG